MVLFWAVVLGGAGLIDSGWITRYHAADTGDKLLEVTPKRPEPKCKGMELVNERKRETEGCCLLAHL